MYVQPRYLVARRSKHTVVLNVNRFNTMKCFQLISIRISIGFCFGNTIYKEKKYMNDLIHVIFLQMGGLPNTYGKNNLRRRISVLQERGRTC